MDTTKLLKKPILITLVHCEEDFDWSKDFSRTAYNVDSSKELYTVQDIFNKHDIEATYAVTYPMLKEALSRKVLTEIAKENKVEIAAHLHPWVNPPFEEEINNINSYPGNLPHNLEKAKIENLTNLIHEVFGVKPSSYLAGRYGAGENTLKILKELGYKIDFSISPGRNYSKKGGPNYAKFRAEPFLDKETNIYRVPHTGGCCGLFCEDGGLKGSFFKGNFGNVVKKLMFKTQLIEELRLSPEGHDLRQLKKLTGDFIKEGKKIFLFSFHSPTLAVGKTPYVQTKKEQKTFLERVEKYMDYFTNEVGGTFLLPRELYDFIEKGVGESI